MNTLTASGLLRRLCDRGLLDLHPAGAASYYTLPQSLQSPADRGEQNAEEENMTPQVTPQVDREIKSFSDNELRDISTWLGLPTPQVATQIIRILEAIETAPISRDALQRAADLSDREHFRKAYLEPLIKAGWLERTIPEKPTSRLQKYRLTERGTAWLARRRHGNLP